MNQRNLSKNFRPNCALILFQTNRVDPALAFRLAVRMETSELPGTKPYAISGFFYPKVVETTVSFRDFREALCCEYPWSPADAVELRYFDSTEQRFLPLTCDEHLGLLFSLNADSRFGKIHIGVLQARKQRIPKGVQTSSVSANSERPRTPCRSRPSKPSGSESHNMSAAANSATSPLPSAPDVEVDAEPDEEVPRHDDEDEILFPELVDRVSQQAVEDEYAEEPSSRARFDNTDDEEREENIDSLVLQEYDGEDMPTIEWNREDPLLTPGTVFESMVDCRNAVTTYCIVTENSYEVDRSEPGRFTVHCPYDRCRWRLHASTMRKRKLIQVLQLNINCTVSELYLTSFFILFQIKSNPHGHTCPPGGGGGKDKSKLAKTRWVADAILDWVRETPTIGPRTLHGEAI